MRRERGQAWKEHDIHPKKNSKTTVMIWIYIGEFGKGDLLLAENKRLWDELGNPTKQSKSSEPKETGALNDAGESEEQDSEVTGFDNKSYVQMIEKQAIPSIKKRTSDFIFVQDNCRVHTATKKNPGNTIYDVFDRQNVNFVSDWPANSPDLHPVENALKLLADEVNMELDRRLKQPKNKAELLKVVQSCWERVDNDAVKRCYNAFSDRLKLCLIHNGNNNFPTSSKRLKNRRLLEEFNLSDYDSNGKRIELV